MMKEGAGKWRKKLSPPPKNLMSPSTDATCALESTNAVEAVPANKTITSGIAERTKEVNFKGTIHECFKTLV